MKRAIHFVLAGVLSCVLVASASALLLYVRIAGLS
jgi:hypothetical protein